MKPNENGKPPTGTTGDEGEAKMHNRSLSRPLRRCTPADAGKKKSCVVQVNGLFSAVCDMCVLCVQRSRSGCGSAAAVWRSSPAAEWDTSSGRDTPMSSPRATPTLTSSKTEADAMAYSQGFVCFYVEASRICGEFQVHRGVENALNDNNNNPFSLHY